MAIPAYYVNLQILETVVYLILHRLLFLILTDQHLKFVKVIIIWLYFITFISKQHLS